MLGLVYDISYVEIASSHQTLSTLARQFEMNLPATRRVRPSGATLKPRRLTIPTFTSTSPTTLQIVLPFLQCARRRKNVIAQLHDGPARVPSVLCLPHNQCWSSRGRIAFLISCSSSRRCDATLRKSWFAVSAKSGWSLVVGDQ